MHPLRRIAPALLCGALALTTGCDDTTETLTGLGDLVQDDGTICLTPLLAHFNLTRDDLGKDSDQVLKGFIDEQKSLLGQAYIIDCEARLQIAQIKDEPLPEVDRCADDPCNGNGECNADDGSCTCNEGFTGFDCGRCAAGYGELSGGGCAAVACAEDSCSGNGACSEVEAEEGGAWAASCACDAGYGGDACELCAEGYAFLGDGATCAALSCNDESCSGKGTCTDTEGEDGWADSCECNEGWTGDDCGELAEGYVELSDGSAILHPCTEDPCNGHGRCSWNEGEALAVTTSCTCDEGYVGDACDACDADNSFIDDPATEEVLDCTRSQCPQSCDDSEHGQCDANDPNNAACMCDEGWGGADCDVCAEGFLALADGSCAAVACAAGSCNGNGECSNVEDAGAWMVACACALGWAGDACDACAEGYALDGNEACVTDTCADGTFCGGHGACEWDGEQGGPGECACEGNFTGYRCGECAEGYAGEACDGCAAGFVGIADGSCVADPCTTDACSSGAGACSVNPEDGSAVCDCAAGYAGDACERCADGYDGFPSCAPLPPPEPEPVVVDECDDATEVAGCLVRQITGDDVVFLFDATGSMRDDQQRIGESFAEIVATLRDAEGRLAIAWYKDNKSCDEPNWFGINEGGLLELAGDDGAANETALQDFMGGISVGGGCDRPESMLDALYEAASTVEWTSTDARAIVVLTDAGFHTGAKSNHTEEEVSLLLATHGVSLRIVNVALAF